MRAVVVVGWFVLLAGCGGVQQDSALALKGPPTGFQVKGCSTYQLDGQKVRQVCDDRAPSEIFKTIERDSPGGGE